MSNCFGGKVEMTDKITLLKENEWSKDTSQTGTRALENRCPLWYDTLIDEIQDD